MAGNTSGMTRHLKPPSAPTSAQPMFYSLDSCRNLKPRRLEVCNCHPEPSPTKTRVPGGLCGRGNPPTLCSFFFLFWQIVPLNIMALQSAGARNSSRGRHALFPSPHKGFSFGLSCVFVLSPQSHVRAEKGACSVGGCRL